MSDTTTNKYKEYVESEAVKAAKQALEQQQAMKPGEYKSQWQDSLNEAMDKILNREKFTYDLNGDALYNQYKDQYVTQGKQAMMDTIGQASALTGGYGNSYAQSVGQQTFQGYLQGLNDKVPELYQMALDRYNQEGQDLYNEYGLYADREDMDYGKYRDQFGDWESERNYLSGQYDTERNYDYGKYSDNRDFTYQQDRDAVADERWQKEFDEAIKQFLAMNPEARAYYETYGQVPTTPTTPSTGSVSTGGTVKRPTTTSGNKSVSQLAQEVLAGKWGNGADRKKALAAAGYDAAAVQAAVNKLIGGSNPSAPTSTPKPSVNNTAVEDYVKRMLDNATSSQFNPISAINANSSLSAAEKEYAKEVANAYIKAGYMKY